MLPKVEFEEEKYIPLYRAEVKPRRGLTGLVQKLGLAKDESQASYILAGLAILTLITVTVTMTRNGVESRPVGPPTPLQEIRGY